MSNELVPVSDLEENYPAIFGEESSELQELLEENLGDDELRASDFPRYKAPSGGGNVWTNTADPEGHGDPEKKIRGIVLLRTTPRAYFKETIEERAAKGDENKRPECSSPDGKYGVGEFGRTKFDPETGQEVSNSNPQNPTGACKTCPMNAFNTARQGAGKACKEREAWWIQKKGALMPSQVQVPAASLKNSREYRVGNLLARGLKVTGVETEFGLKPAKNKAGTAYSEVTFQDVGILDKETARQASEYGRKMKDMLAATAYADATSEVDAEAPTQAAWNPASAESDPNDPWAEETPAE